MDRKLSEDDTIASIVDSLDDPVRYVRGVIGNMVRVHNKHGSAMVRIGTTGRGIRPHYRVDPGKHLEALKALGDRGSKQDYDDVFAHYTAFHGSSHDELDWGIVELQDAHWSAIYMTWDEVRELLGRLLGHHSSS